MIDDWFDVIRLPISMKQFLALPTNPSYKYEYFSKRAILSPRPKLYHATLDLAARDVPAKVDAGGRVAVRLLREDDWDRLPEVFSGAFGRVQPFAALDHARRLDAARQCLDKTRGGGDGPLIEGACFVAADVEDDHPVGVALTTLRPREEDERDDIDDQLVAPIGPHLTWIFVAPMIARHGIGSALLAAVIRRLIEFGYGRLDSTFLLGNESSTLWHWRSGFRLLGYGISPRRLRRMGGKASDGPAEALELPS